MPLDGVTMHALKLELCEQLVGGRIEKIYQPERDEIVLSVHNNRIGYKLLISANPAHPRINITNAEKENPATPPSFCLCLRKWLTGGRIVDITQPGLERVLFVHILATDELGERCEKRIAVEVMGRNSNIILIDHTDKIINCIKHIDMTISSLRLVLPQLKYELPPAPSMKLDPLTVTREHLHTIFTDEGKLEQMIVHGLVGFSPLLARDIIYRACGLVSPYAQEVDREKISAELWSFLLKIRSGDFSPTLLCDGEKMVDFSCMDIELFDDKLVQTSTNECVENYYRLKSQAEHMRQRGSVLTKLVNNLIERAQKKLAIQQETLRTAENREQYRIFGDLLMANLHRIDRHSNTISCENFYEENQMIEIPVLPELTPSNNAQRYYKLYRKAKTAAVLTKQQQEQNLEEITYLESVAHALSKADNVQTLSEIRLELEQMGYIRGGNGKRKVREKPSLPIKIEAPQGYELYVGRNNKQNDYLTFEFASPQDMWLHVKDFPGSHVVIRSKGGPFPDDVIEFGAKVAAENSKANSGVAVDYTLIRNVKKPRGAKPGFCIYQPYETCYVRA